MTESLADRVRALRESAAAAASDAHRRAYHSAAAKTARDFAYAGRFAATLLSGLHWAWTRVAWPLWSNLVRRPLWWLARLYARLWNAVTYARDPCGDRVFSKTRGGLAVVATALFLWFLLGPLLQLAADSVLYAFTGRIDEHVVLLSSQEVDAGRNVHNIEGCWTVECGDTESFYFRVRASLFNQLWNFAHGKGIFYPDYIAASVPTGKNRCVISSYGIRVSAVIRNLNWFPEVLEVRRCDLIGPATK